MHNTILQESFIGGSLIRIGGSVYTGMVALIRRTGGSILSVFYIQRSIQVEGAFGVIKEDMRFRRFTRTGFQGIKLELDLIAIGFNLKKFHNKRYRS